MKSISTMLLVASLLLTFTSPSAIAQPEGSRVRQVAEMDFKKAPDDFKKVLAWTEKEVKEKGGFVLAGKVKVDGQAPPKANEFVVALKFGKSDANDTWKYSGGWFIYRVIRKDRLDNVVMAVSAFRGLPVEVALTLDEGKVNWVIATLQKAPPREQALISGTVIDELGQPVAKAKVGLELEGQKENFARPEPGKLFALTDSEGKYSFDGVTFQAYRLGVVHDQHSSDVAILTSPETASDSPAALGTSSEGSEIQGPRPLKMTRYAAKQGNLESASNNATMILGFLRAVTIDYEYNQRNYFTGDVIKKGVVWRDDMYDNSRIKFASGEFYAKHPLFYDDLRLHNKEGDLFFDHVYQTRMMNGSYDLGEVPFESVEKIDEVKAKESLHREKPCLLNHVYGVITLDGKYAKFVVRKIELLSELEKASGSKRKRP